MSDQAVEHEPEGVDEQATAYSPEQLTAAKEELTKLSPQEWLELQTYVSGLEAQATLPEAGGVCYTTLVSPTGAEVNMTARASHPVEALRALMTGVRFAGDAYKLFPKRPRPVPTTASAPPTQEASAQTTAQALPQRQIPLTQVGASPQPQATAQGQPGVIEVIEVKSVTKQVSPNGKEYLNVKGGMYTKYGLKAWPEVIPPGMDLQNMAVGVEFTVIPDWMRYAAVSPDRKKVTLFKSSAQ